MKCPLVSIIIPAFNPGIFLDQAIECLLGQTYRPIEIILVDDGSDPPCLTYSNKAHLISSHFQPNAGPAGARNAGIKISRGDLIAFHDADDLCDENKIIRQVEALTANPSSGFVLTYSSNFLEAGVELPDWFAHEATLPDRMGSITTALMRRSCIESVGLFNTRYRICEDFEWLVRATELGVEYQVLKEPLFKRRIHHNNSSADIQTAQQNQFAILAESLNRRRALGSCGE